MSDQQHIYLKATEIYTPVAKHIKTYKDFASVNVLGVFVCFKKNIKTIVLDDGAQDTPLYVRAIDQSIISSFERYFRPGYIFRFLSLQCTAVQSHSALNPRSIRLNAKDASTMVVFECLTNSETDNFAYFISENPRILQSDWDAVERLRNDWCSRINSVSIQDLRRILLINERADFEKATFTAQIIEIKQLSPRKMILKLWDGTTPEFDPKLPINQADIDSNGDLFKPVGLRNDELHEKSNGKAIYVLLLGDKIDCFRNHRPGEYVLLMNTKLYYWNKTHPKVFRIEINDFQRIDSEDYQFIVFIKPNSNLGKLISQKLKSRPFVHPVQTTIVQPSKNRLSRPDSFEELTDRNLLVRVNKFTQMRNDRNFEIFCSIVDIFPLDYTVFDLINIQCTDPNCNLDDSLDNVFDIDLSGLRRAAEIFLYQNGLNRNDMNCPRCSNPKAYLKFFIVFLLEDKDHNQMIALFERGYVDRYFELNPLEVVADSEQEEIFMRRVEELKNNFKSLDESPKRDMVITKSKDCYFVKCINFKRDLVA